MSTTTATRPASEKQLALIARLVSEKQLTDAQLEDVAAATSSRDASRVIDRLFAAPRKPQAVAAKAEPGFYRQGEEFIQVVTTRDGQRTYAKRLVVDGGSASWQYAPGVGRTLAGLEPATLEQAQAFGMRFGVCMVCCRTLTNPKSIEAGIGPVCASKF